MSQFYNPSPEEIYAYLQAANTIAVVGLSNRPETASYQVSKQMQALGYQIIPVNPKLAGQEVLNELVYARLADIPQPVDIVNVFRRSEYLPEVARDFLQMDAKVFWAQLGLVSQEAARLLQQAGHQAIVMDKCIKVEYQKLQARSSHRE